MTSAHTYIVSGSKGGVGKSLTTMALLDYLLSSKDNDNLLLIESDNSNPDVAKSYQDDIETIFVDLDTNQGWIELVNLCEQYSDKTIIVNCAARAITGVEQNVSLLRQVMDELKRSFVTFWLINPQQDCIQLLSRYHDAFPESITHVVRNHYFGTDADFHVHDASKLRKTIESKGGKTLTLDALANRVCHQLYNGRLSIAGAVDTLPIGDRAELLRWRHEAHVMFGQVMT